MDHQLRGSQTDMPAGHPARSKQSPFANQAPFDQLIIQPQASQVLRCADCRLLNYSGETECKRCGGRLVNRNASHQQNQNDSQVSSSPKDDPWYRLEKAEKNIRNAWVTGVILATITMIIILTPLGWLLPVDVAQYGAIMAIAVYALSYGTYKRIRICASLLSVLYMLDKVFYYLGGGNMYSLPIVLGLSYIFIKGVDGIIEYNKLTTTADCT